MGRELRRRRQGSRRRAVRRGRPARRALLLTGRDERTICLELTSPEQLVPARPPSEALELEPADASAAALLRETYVRIGAPHGWTGRTSWSDTRWAEELARPNVWAWVARVGGELAGFVELDVGASGDAGIVVLGLVPEFVGRGLGGVLLTEATRLAWELEPPGRGNVRRVWVQTSSGDHPHALRNYEARGFKRIRAR